MRLFDHHMHSTRSDGTVSLEERAASVAIRPHGISDHYPWRTGMRRDDDVLRYLDDAARLGLQVGLEYDLGVAPPLLRSTHDALDYVIGSVHQVTLDGERIGYDLAGAHLKGRTKPPYAEAARFADPALQRRVLETHLALVREGILETGIDIVGHPTMSPLAALGDPEDAYPVEWQEQLIELCAANAVALEINEAYRVPHRAFLERAHARGIRFAVGSDTHFALLPLARTEEMIREAGAENGPFLDGRRVQEGVSTATSS
ncbi:MAG TPA: PHP domain-containing protein [Candidatus Limnocylindria bacterium]|nr:PHP domain-containing protein [Candidatus Limnocylindria bacterium]